MSTNSKKNGLFASTKRSEAFIERIETLRKEERKKHVPSFYSLTQEEQLKKHRVKIREEWVKQQQVTDTALKTMLTCEELLNQIGDFEGTSLYVHEMKKYGNLFLEKLILLNKRLLMESGTVEQDQAFGFINTTENLVNALKRVHSNKYEELTKVVEGFLKLNNADIDDYIESMGTYRFSMIQDYLGGNALIGKLKKHYPSIGILNIHELSLILKRDEILALKGIGQESVNHLQKIFRYGGISW